MHSISPGLAPAVAKCRFAIWLETLCLGSLLVFALASAARADDTLAASANNLLSYIAVDYAESLQGGEIVDESLYRQQRHNAARALELVRQLPDKPGRAALERSVLELDAAMAQKREGEVVRRRANAAADRLAALYQLQRSPTEMLPAASEAAELYSRRCALCHGPGGEGGAAVPSLSDTRRMASFSLFDLYNTLDPASDRPHSEQVDGDLSSRQRWALAVTVAGFAAAQIEAPAAELAQRYPALIGLPGMAITRPVALPEEAGGALLWWRGNPEQVRALENPLARADGLLQLAEAAYRGGDSATAYHQLMLALREGYIPVREQLEARDRALAAQLAQNWQSLRGAILGDASNTEVMAGFQQLRADMARALARLEPPPGTQSIYRWAALLFAAALALGVWLRFGLRRRFKR